MDIVTLKFTSDQLAALRAVWALFGEMEDNEEILQDALEIPNKDRGYNEDGSIGEDYDADKDPVVFLMDQVETILMVDGVELLIE